MSDMIPVREDNGMPSEEKYNTSQTIRAVATVYAYLLSGVAGASTGFGVHALSNNPSAGLFLGLAVTTALFGLIVLASVTTAKN